MTLDEAIKVASVIRQADNGCSTCVRDLVDRMNETFPQFTWTHDMTAEWDDKYPGETEPYMRKGDVIVREVSSPCPESCLTPSELSFARRRIIRREVTPRMIGAGLDILSENEAALNSGEMSAQDFVAQIFGALRFEQLRTKDDHV